MDKEFIDEVERYLAITAELYTDDPEMAAEYTKSRERLARWIAALKGQSAKDHPRFETRA